MAEQAGPECVVEASAEHVRTVVLLHGRGSNGAEFRSELFESLDSEGCTLPERLPTVKWIFPNAGERFSSVFQESLNEWFDVYSLSDPEARQELQISGLQESISQIHKILDRELLLIRPNNLFIGGISQGCATACHALLSYSCPLTGFIGMSGWFPFAEMLEGISATSTRTCEIKQALKKFYADTFSVIHSEQRSKEIGPDMAIEDLTTRALVCHGLDDDVVDVKHGRRLRDILWAIELNVIWREDDVCGHWVKEPESIDAITKFLAS